MSRTIRRKNYERENNTSWDRKGRKCGGMFPQEEFVSEFQVERWSSIWNMGYYYFREPTEKEYNKAFWTIHSDGNYDFYRSRKSFRKIEMHQCRMNDKREISLFMEDSNYEPMCWDRRCAGFWDYYD